ncbi:MAG: four helix bundle protein [Bacteroidia bacterium]
MQNNELNGKRKFDLEDRLIDFAIKVIAIVELIPASRAGNHIAGQLVRSGTSPALNYGEAQSAESRNDFIHKMKICLKELRETKISLKIIYKKPLIQELEIVQKLITENDELISIFMKSISTATENKKTS